jgi:peptide deformylase
MMNTPPSNSHSPLKTAAARILPIIKYPDPILETPCSPVTEITPDLLRLASDMLATLRASGLVGIAAPQVAVSVDLMVVDVRRSKRQSRLYLAGQEVPANSLMPLILFNAEIAPNKKVRRLGFEGCGSAPGIRVEIERPAATFVRAINQNGESIRFACADLLARVIQQEWDHLRGILFMDRMSPETLSSVQPLLDELRRSKTVTGLPPTVTPDGYKHPKTP